MDYDFSIYNPAGRLVAVLEAKAVRNVSGDWATQYRINLAEHPGLPDSDHFGIVTPDTLYLWQRRGLAHFEERPDFEIDLSESFGQHPDRFLRGKTFELVVSSWLSDLIEGEKDLTPQLRDSGLPEAIRHGRLRIEAAA